MTKKRRRGGSRSNHPKTLVVEITVGASIWTAVHKLSDRRNRDRLYGGTLLEGLQLLQELCSIDQLNVVIQFMTTRGYRPPTLNIGTDPTGVHPDGKGRFVTADQGDVSIRGKITSDNCRIRLQYGEIHLEHDLKKHMRELPGYAQLPKDLELLLRAINRLGAGQGMRWVDPVVHMARAGGYQGGLTFLGSADDTSGTLNYLPNIIYDLQKGTKFQRREGKRECRSGILLYIDLLGIKTIIDRDDTDLLGYIGDRFAQAVSYVWELTNGWYKCEPNAGDQVERRMQLFSDSVVFTAEDSPNGMRLLCQVARLLISEGILLRFAVRGYICRGQIEWYGENIGGSPALRTAAAGERKLGMIGVEVEPALAKQYGFDEHAAGRVEYVTQEGHSDFLSDWYYTTIPTFFQGKRVGTATLISWMQGKDEILQTIRLISGATREEDLPAQVRRKSALAVAFVYHVAQQCAKRHEKGLPTTILQVVSEPLE